MFGFSWEICASLTGWRESSRGEAAVRSICERYGLGMPAAEDEAILWAGRVLMKGLEKNEPTPRRINSMVHRARAGVEDLLTAWFC